MISSRLTAAVAWFAVASFPLSLRADDPAATAKAFSTEIEPILVKYCYDCHGDGMDKGDFKMDDYEKLDDHLANMLLWFDVWETTRAGLMPPAKKPQPTDAERAKLIAWVERDVFKLDPENPDPGVVTVRRLNRVEYRNTIQDLFGVRSDVTEDFPPDDTGYGFDTIGDVLSISPLLMEKYIQAAANVVEEAVPTEGPKIPTKWVNLGDFKDPKNEKHTLGWIGFQSPREYVGKPWINYDGEYEARVEFEIKGSMEATSNTATFALKLGDQPIAERNVGWDNSKSISLKTKVKLKKGNGQEFRFSITPDKAPLEGENALAVSVQRMTLYGPLDGSVKEYPSEFRDIFFDGPPPSDAKARDDYRRELLKRVATRAFRRPVDEPTLDRLVALSQMIESQPGKKFEHGIGHALTAILSSPRFLFRAEIQAEPDNPAKIVPIDEYALASRLSYFLWSSCPDDELLKIAGEGKLRENLRAQVDRMLADKKSDRFINNFVGQWLQARDVETINIDARRILEMKDLGQALKIFNNELRKSMRLETELFFAHILRENRPATELLSADYTFLNERLANWYGIEDVKGNDMRKVSLPADSKRGGLLTQSTFLIVTSNPTRTSPVKRGLFVLENLLATPSPPALPDVPPLEDAQKGKNKNLPLREILKIHSEQALCASCHNRMDPIGLALENFNALGAWQDNYRGNPIDASGELVTGEKFSNAQELSKILSEKRFHDFHRALAEKLLTYAVGRGVEYYDAPSVDGIVNKVETGGGTLRELLYGIIESAPFQKRRGDGDLFSNANE
ncbi:MAG: DUF1592 domain-containing protein [Verrucomicrobiae bacterium]|nr:DUF1592 domain-containing protein [Verrucomicrobiae bacterium]